MPSRPDIVLAALAALVVLRYGAGFDAVEP